MASGKISILQVALKRIHMIMSAALSTPTPSKADPTALTARTMQSTEAPQKPYTVR